MKGFLLDKVCTGGGVPCKMPFTFNGNIHFECITGGEGELIGRCPISDTEWAKCDPSCPLQRYNNINVIIIFVLIIIIIIIIRYTENEEINTHFRHLVDQFPDLAKIVTVGRSSLDQEILGIRQDNGFILLDALF